MADLIYEKVWIGDLNDAVMAHWSFSEPDHEFDNIIDCRGILDPDEFTGKVDMDNIDAVARMIEACMINNRKTLVHCVAGMERSVLAVLWWLYNYRGLSLTDAWMLIRKKRTCAKDRRNWLELEGRK